MKITITTRLEGSRAVADPDPLIAAVPALLGFVPERSIVFMCFDDRIQVTATMRHDLEFTSGGRTPAAMRALFARLGDLASSYGSCGVIAVLVDDRYEPSDERFRRTARDVRRAFTQAGGLTAAFAIGEVRAGAYWRTTWQSPRSAAVFGHDFAVDGLLSDPQASPAALHRAFETGRLVLRSRSEIAAMLAPVDHCESQQCAAVTPPARTGPMSADDGPRLARLYDAVVERACGDAAFTCEQLNELAQALVSVHVRDAAIGLSMTVHRDAAEELWTDLTRRLAGTPRAAAATLLGHLHYMEGSGAFASAAFDVAHDADPSYGLANLLDTALRHGMRPQELGGIADMAFDLARAMGVRFPPATHRAAG
ncbi:DUF4192 domain-containing protein [Gordonia liuliyuniae]|uniref:DUF4192 domain-containing protein n=1 Tax=Gordonia liuliyuniae TaxID=2911517 RepID=A0ABS9IRC9_9ACTN|nr:DUF4192 domain-containing protein [Gordonia liuliyuniae]MCF8588108.1 DUF4192 domain-containing protein [Gordonia liuliyuniae]